MVAEDGLLKLGDFGLSKTPERIGSIILESSNSAGRGTIPFMSREQICDNPAPTIRSDMWAASCVFVEVRLKLLGVAHFSLEYRQMMTGRPPYHDAPSVSAVILKVASGELPARPPEVADALWQLVTMNWAEDPSTRLPARRTVERLRTLRAYDLCGEPLSYL